LDSREKNSCDGRWAAERPEWPRELGQKSANAVLHGFTINLHSYNQTGFADP
jgi:hypothetical protein